MKRKVVGVLTFIIALVTMLAGVGIRRRRRLEAQVIVNT